VQQAEQNLTKCGFCYVADCEAYVDEALESIASLRMHMPEVAVALVTPLELFRPDSRVTDWIELKQKRRGPIVKTDAWLAPYERVVFLDTDTLVISDLADVFPLLDRFDFINSPEPNARSDRGITAGVPITFPEANSGFFAFRKSEAVSELFQTWLSEYDALNVSEGVTANQPSLRIAMWQSEKVRQLTLGSEYNLIVHANCCVSGSVKILHDRSPDRERMAKMVNRHIGPRAVIAGFGPVFGYFTRRGWIRQYLTLSWRFLRVLLRPGVVMQQGHPVIWWREGVD
jgi:hypothetical protein